MSNQVRVLSIDDDQMVQNVVRKTLKDHFVVDCASNAKEGISKAHHQHPDIILLDVEMPGMNGYEACDQLKQSEDTADIPVLFLSSLSDIRSRMIGFEVGAIDFLIKPFESKELLAKLNTIGQLHKSQSELIDKTVALQSQAAVATETAYTAMRGSSELGASINYIESSFFAKTHSELAALFLTTTSTYSLNCTLMIITSEGEQFYSNCSKDVSPLEKEVLKTIHATGIRFKDFGCRTQINYTHVALLVKNMPIDDMESYGRYKDFLPTMLGATDAKVIGLETEKALVSQTKNLTSSFEVVQSTLSTIGDNLSRNQGEVLSLLENMLKELDQKIPQLGLEDDQERYIIDRLDTTVTSAQGIIDKSNETGLAFATVTRLLQHLVEKQHRMLEDLYTDKTHSDHEIQEDNDQSSGIDLF